jgi:hypothetical protein
VSITADLRTLAQELRGSAERLPLRAAPVGVMSRVAFQAATQVEKIDKLQAGRIRRAAGRITGWISVTPMRQPDYQELLDLAGEIEAVVGALSARTSRTAPAPRGAA